MTYLIDTNVISELRKGKRAQDSVIEWFEQAHDSDLFISVLTIGEIKRGITKIARRDPISAEHLSQWLLQIKTNFSNKLIPVDDDIAELWGELSMLRPISMADGLLAATAQIHQMTLVTRNIKDFNHFPITVFNPFDL